MGQPVSKTYRLSTLRDVFEQIPPDKVALCMREIAEGMVRAREVSELFAQAEQPPANFVLEDVWEWIDDGRQDKTITVVDDATDKELFAFEYRRDGQ